MEQSVMQQKRRKYDGNATYKYMLDSIAYLTEQRRAAAQTALDMQVGRSEADYRERFHSAKWHIDRIDYVLDALKLWWT